MVTHSSAYFGRLVCDLFICNLLTLLLSLERNSEHGPPMTPSNLELESRK